MLRLGHLVRRVTVSQQETLPGARVIYSKIHSAHRYRAETSGFLWGRLPYTTYPTSEGAALHYIPYGRAVGEREPSVKNAGAAVKSGAV